MKFFKNIIDTWYIFKMPNNFLKRIGDMFAGVLIGILIGADILFAKSIKMNEAGVTLWIFLVAGGFIILLQAIPAFILFTTFVATMYRRSKEHL